MIPKLYMIIGLPGSGKTAAAQILQKEESAVSVSTQTLRKQLTGSATDKSQEEKVHVLAHKEIRENLVEGKPVIYDSASVKRSQRIALIRELKNIPCQKICVCVATPLEKCLSQDEKEIKDKYLEFNPAHYAEGFGEIRFEFGDTDFSQYSLNDLFYGENGLIRFEQDNSHHQFSLGDHCLAAEKYVRRYAPDDKNLQLAALLHDIGKVATKSPYNSNGEIDGDFHYYSHHNAGAYDSLFYLKALGKDTKDIVDISNLIAFHMHPYLGWKTSEKVLRKDTRIFGEEFVKRVYLLHRADVAAH